MDAVDAILVALPEDDRTPFVDVMNKWPETQQVREIVNQERNFEEGDFLRALTGLAQRTYATYLARHFGTTQLPLPSKEAEELELQSDALASTFQYSSCLPSM